MVPQLASLQRWKRSMLGVTEESAPVIEGHISGGLSDFLILSISLAGFIFVGLGLYVLVLRKTSQPEDEDVEGKRTRTYEEELDDADVRTLNRAQLRARAKNRMKKNRRIAQQAAGGDAGEGEDGDPAAVAEAVANIDANDGNLGPAHSAVRHMSRKERTKAAKAAEREERRRYMVERQEQIQASYRERKEREKEEKAAEDEEERYRANCEREEQERAEYERWKTMFTSDAKSKDGDDVVTMATSVSDFVEYIKKIKVAKIKDLALHFWVEPKAVYERIKQLQQEGRISGIIDNAGNFILITPNEMRALTGVIKSKGKLSLSDLAWEISHIADVNQAGME